MTIVNLKLGDIKEKLPQKILEAELKEIEAERQEIEKRLKELK